MDVNWRKQVLFLVCCLVCAFDICITLTVGNMFVQLLETFRDTRAATATFQAVFIGTNTCFCIVAGVLIRRYGVVRSTAVGTALLSGGFILSFFATSILMLNILVGVISGIGVSLLFISSTVLVRNSFERRNREIALTFIQITMGVGVILYPFLIKLLMYEYGVHGTFLILGGLFLNNSVLPVLTYTNKQLIEPTEDKHGQETADATGENNVTRKAYALQMLTNGMRHVTVLFNFRYTVVLVASGFVISSGNAYLIVFEDIFTWKQEFTPSDILRLWTAYSSSAIVGRALPIVSSMAKPGSDMILLLLSCAISACLGQALLLLSSSKTAAFAANVFAGFTQGCIISTTTVSIANISSKQVFGVAFGLFLTVDGVLSMLLGPLYGLIRDKQRSYELVIASSAVLNAFSALMFATAIMKQFYKRTTWVSHHSSSQTDVDASL